MKDRNTTLDIFKAIACIGVVFMHVNFPEPLGDGVRALGGIGVPFFFAISGYYLFSQSELTSESIVAKIRNIFKIILCSEVGYILFSFLYNMLMHPKYRIDYVERYFKQGWLEQFVLTNAPPVYGHLWFLYSLLLIYFFVLCCVRSKADFKKFAILTPILLFGIVVFQEFSFLQLCSRRVPIVGINGFVFLHHTLILRALPFFFLGFWFNECKEWICKLKLPYNGLLIFIFLMEAMSFFEGGMFKVVQFYVGNILALMGVMAFCISYPDCKSKWLQYCGKSLSLYVYVIHIAVFKLVMLYASKFGIVRLSFFKWSMPIIVLLLTLCLAVVLDKIISKYNCRRSLIQ